MNEGFQQGGVLVYYDPLECPFCRLYPVVSGYRVEIGGGDNQWVWAIECKTPDCVQPAVRIRGQRGYKRDEDMTNQQAYDLARERWNKRSIQPAIDTLGLSNEYRVG